MILQNWENHWNIWTRSLTRPNIWSSFLHFMGNSNYNKEYFNPWDLCPFLTRRSRKRAKNPFLSFETPKKAKNSKSQESKNRVWKFRKNETTWLKIRLFGVEIGVVVEVEWKKGDKISQSVQEWLMLSSSNTRRQDLLILYF